MQIKNNQLNYLPKSWIIRLVKLLLLTGCLFFLITKFQDQSFLLDQFKFPEGFEITLVIVLILMIINWYLESLRWKYSIETFEPISIIDAWKVVLGGLTLNWMLPFTSGDLLTRISQQQDKYQATAAAMLNRSIMFVFTLLFGTYGIKYLSVGYELNGWILVLVASILLLGFLFRKSFSQFMIYFRQSNAKTLSQIIVLSLLRYIIFVFQFFLLMRAFLPMLSAELLLAGIGWIFLVRSILPLFFGGMGVREASGVLFFEAHTEELHLVLIPIFLIWIINTVLPSLVGLFFVWRLKSFWTH